MPPRGTGKHVPSTVPGEGARDWSGAVGSNVHGLPGPDVESPQILTAPPFAPADLNNAQYDPPLT